MPHAISGSVPRRAGRSLVRCAPVWLLSLFLVLLAGCAQPRPSPENMHRTLWTGRLALQVEGQPSQSFSASFELSGTAQQGRFEVFTPLGGTLVQLRWGAGHAELITAEQTRQSESLDALLQEALGADIPVAALFSWLEGNPAAAQGWQTDLSAIAQGRLVAYRFAPQPQATLRIALTH